MDLFKPKNFADKQRPRMLHKNWGFSPSGNTAQVAVLVECVSNEQWWRTGVFLTIILKAFFSFVNERGSDQVTKNASSPELSSVRSAEFVDLNSISFILGNKKQLRSHSLAGSLEELETLFGKGFKFSNILYQILIIVNANVKYSEGLNVVNTV